MPNVPDYIKGVLSLRGVIVPVIDLRQRFEMEPAEYTSSTVVIVLLLDAGDGEKIYGIVVNEVSNFIEVPEESVQPAPEFGVEMNKDYLTAITTLEDRMIMLLDANKIVLSTELDQLSEAV